MKKLCLFVLALSLASYAHAAAPGGGGGGVAECRLDIETTYGLGGRCWNYSGAGTVHYTYERLCEVCEGELPDCSSWELVDTDCI